MLDYCENIFKLLRRTEDMFEERSKLGVGGYTNSDFISDVDDRISISRMYFYVNILEGF